jgi:hypothetical protein
MMSTTQKVTNGPGLSKSKKETSSSWARPLIGIGVILAVMIVFAMLQGNVRGRWSSSHALQEAAARLDQLPESFGPWLPVQSIELQDYALDELEMANYRAGIYEHEQTGERVTLLLMLGPSGLMAVHTPEICLGNQAYRTVGQRTRKTFIVEEEADTEPQVVDTFWKSKFQDTAIDGNYHVIYYAWSMGDKWETPKNPRMEFGLSPYLYKVHVGASALNEGFFEQKDDPASRFLKFFIPEARCLAP